MSYQVLARKWRPKSFRDMAGQSHVLKALINALDHDRLHHAYLFTGTRGVGKTTIARILVRCLNCEQGVSSEPCGQCSSCVAINEGRFVDLIEVDAASRTKVEDTRELLDNVQYSPTQGRYKVYLIDEVHMLSTSSFNALLKTLEEPPPHVKFLLATTDPQKIPATILSRCLQFSLKNLSPERVVDYLKVILDKEMVSYEEPALWLLGRAADGSMRDALSLTDQAIAFGSGKLGEHDVRQMLGTIDHGAVYRIVEALIAADAPGLLNVVAELAELGADFAGVASELLVVLHRLAIAQTLPDGLDNSLGDRQRLLELAGQLSAEEVQFYYQMTLVGRRDLGLAPDLRSGLEMLLLRLLAFKPEGVVAAPVVALPGGSQAAGAAPSEKKSPTSVAAAVDAPGPLTGAGQEPAPPSKPEPIAPAAIQEPSAEAIQEPSATAAQQKPAAVAAHASPPSPSASDVPAATGQHTGSAKADTTAPSVPMAAVQATPQESPAAVPQSTSPADDLDTDTDDHGDDLSEYEQYMQSADAAFAEKMPTLGEPDEPAAVATERLASEHATAATTPDGAAEPAEAIPLPRESGAKLAFDALTVDTWREQFANFELPGMLGSIASHCQIAGGDGERLEFQIAQDNATLLNDRHVERLAEHLSDYFERKLKVTITIADVAEETPAEYRERQLQLRLAEARAAIESDPVVQQIINDFGAEIEPESLRLTSTRI